MNNDERLVDIEFKVSHQEIQIEKLEQVVFDQQKKLDELEKKFSQLIKSIEEGMIGPQQIGPGNEKPPHY